MSLLAPLPMDLSCKYLTSHSVPHFKPQNSWRKSLSKAGSNQQFADRGGIWYKIRSLFEGSRRSKEQASTVTVSLNCCEMADLTSHRFLESAGKLWRRFTAAVFVFSQGERDWLNILATGCSLHCVHGKWNGQAEITKGSVFLSQVFVWVSAEAAVFRHRR